MTCELKTIRRQLDDMQVLLDSYESKRKVFTEVDKFKRQCKQEIVKVMPFDSHTRRIVMKAIDRVDN